MLDFLWQALIMIGAPGSGKSTIAEKVAKMWKIDLLSADAIRAEKFPGEAYDSGHNAVVWDTLYNRFNAFAAQGLPVILDATNAFSYDRRKLVQHVAGCGYSITGVWVQVPLQVCLDRNAARLDKVPVPDQSINKAWISLQDHPPTYYEGYQKLLLMDVKGNISSVRKPRFSH